MSDPARSDSPPATASAVPVSLRLDDLERLSPGAPALSEPLPDWVTAAHLQWLETGKGDPWGGFFS
jgi:hypothetical protein